MAVVCKKNLVSFQKKEAQSLWEEVCVIGLKVFLQVLGRTRRNLQAETLFKALKELEFEQKPFTFFMDLADKNPEVILFSKEIAVLLEVSAVEMLEKDIHRLFPEDSESISMLLRKFYQFKKDLILRRANSR